MPELEQKSRTSSPENAALDGSGLQIGVNGPIDTDQPAGTLQIVQAGLQGAIDHDCSGNTAEALPQRLRSRSVLPVEPDVHVGTLPPLIELLPEPAFEHIARPGQKHQQGGDVRQKPGSDQTDAGYKNEQTVEKLLGRHEKFRLRKK